MNEYTLFKLDRAIAAALFKQGNTEQATDIFSDYINKLLSKDADKEELTITRNVMLELLNNKDELSEDVAQKLSNFQHELKTKKNNSMLIECANCLNTVKQDDLALEILNEVKEKNTEYYKILGDIYFNKNEFENALKNYSLYIEHNKTDSKVFKNIGKIYEKLFEQNFNDENLEKAFENFGMAYDVSHEKEILKNEISTAKKLGKKEVLKDLWEELLRSNPDDKDYYNYSLFCTEIGDFETAKKYIDYRLKVENEEIIYPQKPIWDCKEDISGKVLLVMCEHKICDTFKYCRFLKEAVEHAKKVIFITQSETTKILKESFPDIDIFPENTDLNLIKFDYYIPLMFLIKLWDFSKPYEPYFKVNSQDSKMFKIRNTDQRAFNVGIVYSKSQKEKIPFEYFKKLQSIKDIKIYSFETDENYSDIKKENNVIFLGKHFNDFYDVALAIKNMHVLISFNDTVTSLAGALGKSTFALANKSDEDISSWYKSITYLKPEKTNEWEKLSVKVKKEIEQYRVKIKEKYLLAFLDKSKREDNLAEVESLITQNGILYHLYKQTYDIKYVKQSEENIKRILKINPERYSSMASLANAYLIMGDYEKCDEYWKKCIDKIDSPDSLFSYSCFQCFKKNFDEFFKYYPMRLIKKQDPTSYPDFKKPKWAGEKDVSDKTLLVHFEQGFGDTFLFSRNLTEVSQIFKKVIFVVQTPAEKLIKDSFPNIEVISRDSYKILQNNINFDYHIPLIDIQGVLKFYPTEYNRISWLKADEEKIKEFSKYILNNKFNIGIFWESQESLYKRFTDLETIIPLAYIDKVQLYSLSINKEDIEVNYIDDNINIINLGKNFKDFTDTAAAIENMDLVVATDSSVMNLSGALGKKTFGLFNQLCEWRWYKLEGEDVDWYKTVKPFQAKVQDEFAPLIDQMKKEIEVLVKDKFST